MLAIYLEVSFERGMVVIDAIENIVHQIGPVPGVAVFRGQGIDFAAGVDDHTLKPSDVLKQHVYQTVWRLLLHSINRVRVVVFP